MSTADLKTQWETLKAESDRLERVMWKSRSSADVETFKAAWLKTQAAKAALEAAERSEMTTEEADRVQAGRTIAHGEMSREARREQEADGNREE